ncbi:hypothetical protein FACS1894107_06100 [Planctomycetales bacterium]|nr:hypothetical protein FACS1894107_06100 [Planctomycetales bacterium]
MRGVSDEYRKIIGERRVANGVIAGGVSFWRHGSRHKKVGEVVYLFPPTAAADIFMRGITGFSADFMENGREQGAQAARQDF